MNLETPRTLLVMAWLAPALCCVAIAQPSGRPEVPSLSSIVQGMEKAQSEGRAQTPYQVIREYRLFGATSSGANADVVAQVDFKPPTGRPCYVLGLKPKRKEKELVSGDAWVDKRSFFILHIEGESSKAPSWWLKSVRVKMSFGDFSGVWLQTSMEAVADVRLLGFHTLTSRILDYRGTDMSASTRIAPDRIQLLSQDPGH